MAVTLDDVRHVAALARLALDVEHAQALTAELNSILRHMDVLTQIDTAGTPEVAGIGAAGLPLRPDAGPPIPMARTLAEFAPRTEDGFFLVPRIATHDGGDASS